MSHPWITLSLVVYVVVLGMVTLLIATGRLKLKGSFKVITNGVDLRALAAFTREKHPRIKEYLSANWSGAPEQLPHVLESLLAELDHDARERGLTLNREMLKSILASSVRAHRVVKTHDLGEAMKQVA
jgi:hypothetical protein